MPDRKIAFMHPRWQKGGVEQTNRRWASFFKSQGLNCLAVTWGGSDDEKLYAPLQAVNLPSELAAYRHMLATLGKDDILIICQTYFLPRAVFMLAWLRLRGVRLVLAERNSFDQYNAYPIKKQIYRWAFPWLMKVFHHIIVNAQEMADEAIFKAAQSKLSVLRNPRFSDDDMALLQGVLPREVEPRVYTFCRWADQKDPQFLMHAADLFAADGISFEVFCNRNELSFQKPFVDNALRHMAEKPAIVLFCSKFEGYPNLLVEARALGLPIIYAPCKTGVREILADYDAAFEFDKRKPRGLVAAFEKAREFCQQNKVKTDMEFARAHVMSEVHARQLRPVLA